MLFGIFTLFTAISLSTAAMEPTDTDALASGTGTVNAVMAAEREVNITHKPIPALGWPGMTMDFRLADAVSLEGIDAGAEVIFRLRPPRA
jgi:Cu/Ag efflux protein CusF